MNAKTERKRGRPRGSVSTRPRGSKRGTPRKPNFYGLPVYGYSGGVTSTGSPGIVLTVNRNYGVHGRSPGTNGKGGGRVKRKYVRKLKPKTSDNFINNRRDGRSYNLDVDCKDSEYHYGSDFENYTDSDVEPKDNESVHEFSEDDDLDLDGSLSSCSDDSVSGSSTTSGSTNRRFFQREETPIPIWLQEKDFPKLVLPPSSEDLLIPRKHVMEALGIYEILRHFWTMSRLSPFRFEDFCAALEAEDLCPLFVEVNMMLLKALLREDDSLQTQYAPLEQKDSVNINFYVTDSITWPEILRSVLKSCPDFEKSGTAKIIAEGNYPYATLENRLNVLGFLVNNFLSTTHVRESLVNEGKMTYDTHCRVCHKPGGLLCCETCPAAYHLNCLDPPLTEVPEEDWHCSVCYANEVTGVTDCTSPLDIYSNRQDPLGTDRHGRKYWFLVRRIFVEDDDGEVWYYSIIPQLEDLMAVLDDQDLEGDLCHQLRCIEGEVIRQMAVTEKITKLCQGNKKSYFEVERDSILKRRVDKEVERQKKEEESRREEAKINAMIEGDRVIEDTINMNDQMDIIDGGLMSETGESRKSQDLSDPTDDPKLDAKTVAPGAIITRHKAQQIAQGTYLFKLGMEGSHKSYSNQYSSKSLLSLSKQQHQEERDKKRFLSHKFSLTQASEFKWMGSIFGNRAMLISCLRQTLLHMETLIPVYLMHSNWTLLKKPWQGCVSGSYNPRDFIRSLGVIATCIKPIAFVNIWHDALGHTRLVRRTAINRDEKKKADKRELREKAIEEDNNRLHIVKFTRGLRHNVYKQKGEEYRLHGQWGWRWLSCARTVNYHNSIKLGLKGEPAKLLASVSDVHSMKYNPMDPKTLRFLLRAQQEMSGEMESSGELSSSTEDGSSSKLVLDPALRQALQNKQIVVDYNPLGYAKPVPLVDVSGSLSSNQRIFYPKIAKKSKLDDFLARRMSLKDGEIAVTQPTVGPKVKIKEEKVEVKKEEEPEAEEEEDEDKVKIKTEDPFVADLFNSAQVNPLSVASKIVEMKSQLENVTHVCGSLRCYCSSCPYDLSACFSPTCYQLISLQKRMEEVRRTLHTIQANKNRGRASKVRLKKAGEKEEPPESETKVQIVSEMSIGTKPEKDDVSVGVNTCELSSSGRVYLRKLKNEVKKKRKIVKYPMQSTFRSKIGRKYSMLILPPHVLKRIARRAGNYYVPGFNHSVRPNWIAWPYPCARPLFRTCWFYRNSQANSLHAVAQQLKVLWHCLRWDDFQSKAPALDTKNTYTTDSDQVTIEILNKKTEGRFDEITQYQVKKTAKPLDVPVKQSISRPSYDQDWGSTGRSGLRKRRRVESPVTVAPTITEEWVAEETLEIWQIRMYWERNDRSYGTMARTRLLQTGASSPAPVKPKLEVISSSKYTNEEIKDKMEQQLRMQRSALRKQVSTRGNSDGKSVIKFNPVQTSKEELGGKADVAGVKSIASSTNLKRLVIPGATAPPPGVQHVQITKTADGKLQVTGLRPGQQLVQLPGGRIQVIPKPVTNPPPLLPKVMKHDAIPLSVSTPTATPVLSVAQPTVNVAGPSRPATRVQLVQTAAGGTKLLIQGSPTLTPQQLASLQDQLKGLTQTKSQVAEPQVATAVQVPVIQPAVSKAPASVSPPKAKPERQSPKKKSTNNQMLLSEDVEDMDELLDLNHVPSPPKGKKKTESGSLPRKRQSRGSGSWDAPVTPALSGKQLSILHKHKEQLKKDMLRKRALLEKEIHIQIQEEIALATVTKETEPQSDFDYTRPPKKRKISEKEKEIPTPVPPTPPPPSPPPPPPPVKKAAKQKIICKCRKPYDPSKFCVGCDHCGNWFHGSCVGISEASSKSLSEYICDDCKQAQETQELFCLCRKPYDEKMFYICCDACEGWFHGKCVGILQAESESIDEYMCPACDPNTALNKANLKHLNDLERSHVKRVLKQIQNHKNSGPFQDAEEDAKLPNGEPEIDLTTIENRLNKKQYRQLYHWIADVGRIFDQVRVYCAPTSSKHRQGRALETYTASKLKQLRTKLIENT